MKGQSGGSAVAIASLAREGFEPNGDLIFVAAADEEVGVDFAAPGSAASSPTPSARNTCSTKVPATESRSAEAALPLLHLGEDDSPFVLRVHGRPATHRAGHRRKRAVKAAKLIQRLGEFSPQPQLEPEVAAS